jgi:uncharacterized secreted protein with C-terminal beta-propeller domain
MAVNPITGVFVFVMFLAVNIGICFVIENYQSDRIETEKSGILNNFSSFEEIKAFLGEPIEEELWMDFSIIHEYINYFEKVDNKRKVRRYQDVQMSSGTDFITAPYYTTTNIQVDGIDEGDIKKNDGDYLYLISGNSNETLIIDIREPENLKILSTISVEWIISEIYVQDNKIILTGSQIVDLQYSEGRMISYSQETNIGIFNIENRSNPQMVKSYKFEGYRICSRLINNYLYLVLTDPAENLEEESDLPAPPHKIFYLNNKEENYHFYYIISINVKSKSTDFENMIMLMGRYFPTNVFVSKSNLYLAISRNRRDLDDSLIPDEFKVYSRTTIIHRFSINNGNIEYIANIILPGTVRSKYWMDEYKNHFRLVTSTRNSATRNNGNYLFILDFKLQIIGQLKDFAPREKIYSARFEIDKCYVVTFERIIIRVDPLFIIDLKLPKYPKVLGELIIPGYSTYLHLYGNNHLIGIGYDFLDSEEDFSSGELGVKISLFNISNTSQPLESSNYIIGDRGTESDALSDPHKFLLSEEKHILILPILLAEINHSKSNSNVWSSQRGEYTWDGIFIFNISSNESLELRGKISHLSEEDMEVINKRYSLYYIHNCYKKIITAFIVGDILFTISYKLVQLNDLTTLKTIDSLELP